MRVERGSKHLARRQNCGIVRGNLALSFLTGTNNTDDLVLHVSLAILLITDAVETQHSDLLTQLIPARTDAERHGLDALAFGQKNTYTLSGAIGSSGSSSLSQPTDGCSVAITVSLLSIDPYPHHVVASVQLMRRAIDRDLATKELDAETHASRLAILNRSLELLPSSSKSVRAARKQASSQGAEGYIYGRG